ncbi:lytic murein transglycosylase, partial [Micrococcus sp. SIMBA_144]
HTQFMPLTWLGWNYPGGDRLGNASIPDSILHDPAMIKKYGGYGVDANGDGKADPYDLEDAIFSTANYLSANGASKGDIEGAVYAYNHA